LIAEASRRGERLAIRGGNSKGGIGRPTPQARDLDMRAFDGVVDYDPPELVLTVRPATPLATVQSLVAEQGQMLAFEPFDHGPIFGRSTGAATIGGVVAAAVAGSQRVASGGARDHLLGVRAVSGRGELFISGAKVVKNVTGYDLPKLIAGSWGRLSAITELTLKVLPAPRVMATRVIRGLDPDRAVAAMAAAMGSQAEIAAAAHWPANGGITAFRLQGFHASVAARCANLMRFLEPFGRLDAVDDDEAAMLWTGMVTLASLPQDLPLWRVIMPPGAGGKLVGELERHGAQWLLDWAGGLAWIALGGEEDIVRAAAAAVGGHALLVRAPPDLRDRIAAFHPPHPGVAALEERVRRAFDPAMVFETGRF